MATRRGVGWIAGLACGIAALLTACAGNGQEGERFPTSGDYPPGTMARVSLLAGGGHPWRLSALQSPANGAPWRAVIVTGTPSWSEYWAPTIAQAPPGREIIVADRPGFAQSEPRRAVTTITQQAQALAALVDAAPEGQRIVVIGQSYGGPVSVMLAGLRPERVEALVLMSAYFGDRASTGNRLFAIGQAAAPLLPRDLKNAVAEVRNQPPQLPAVRKALAGLEIPIVVLHGDSDTFVPLSAAQRLADEANGRLVVTPGGDHFLNACCVNALWGAIEEAIAAAEARRPALTSVSLEAGP